MLENKLKQTIILKTFYNNFFSIPDQEPRALNVVGSRCEIGRVLFIQSRSVPGFLRSRLEHWQERGEKVVDPDLRRLNCSSLKSDFFFKVFLEFVITLILFYVLVFWPRGLWNLNSQTRVEPAPPALKGKILTPGPPGKSPVQ